MHNGEMSRCSYNFSLKKNHLLKNLTEALLYVFAKYVDSGKF